MWSGGGEWCAPQLARHARTYTHTQKSPTPSSPLAHGAVHEDNRDAKEKFASYVPRSVGASRAHAQILESPRFNKEGGTTPTSGARECEWPLSGAAVAAAYQLALGGGVSVCGAAG